MSSKFTTTVQQYADTEDYYVEIPDHILKTLNWQEGDELAWSVKEGKIIITKIKDTDSTKEEPTVADYDFYDEKYDEYIEETAKETFGQYYHSPEAQGGWYAIKAEAIRKYA